MNEQIFEKILREKKTYTSPQASTRDKIYSLATDYADSGMEIDQIMDALYEQFAHYDGLWEIAKDAYKNSTPLL
jgi:lipoate-protein ligase A